jgi:hypothetical protein
MLDVISNTSINENDRSSVKSSTLIMLKDGWIFRGYLTTARELKFLSAEYEDDCVR